MLIILASCFDREAQALADRWSSFDATLLTAEDLSVAGWRFYANAAKPSTAIIRGRMVAEQDISGVLVRWPAIHSVEVRNVIQDDRAYVAAEMTAFLCAWLTHLKCPVLNRPTASALFGPAWRPEQWVYAGAKLGIRVCRMSRRTGGPPISSDVASSSSSTVVTVVGNQTFGACDPVLKHQARRLAIAAGVSLLAVHFDGSEQDAALLTADLLPDLSDPQVCDAVLGYLLGELAGSASRKEAG